MMENIMNAVNAVMSACRESLDHTNDDYERVTILVSRVGWVQVLNDAQVMKPECLLRVGSGRLLLCTTMLRCDRPKSATIRRSAYGETRLRAPGFDLYSDVRSCWGVGKSAVVVAAIFT